jgi:hypothetical protein
MKSLAAKTAGYLNVWNYFFNIRSLTSRQADGEGIHYPFQDKRRALKLREKANQN